MIEVVGLFPLLTTFHTVERCLRGAESAFLKELEEVARYAGAGDVRWCGFLTRTLLAALRKTKSICRHRIGQVINLRQQGKQRSTQSIFRVVIALCHAMQSRGSGALKNPVGIITR